MELWFFVTSACVGVFNHITLHKITDWVHPKISPEFSLYKFYARSDIHRINSIDVVYNLCELFHNFMQQWKLIQ